MLQYELYELGYLDHQLLPQFPSQRKKATLHSFLALAGKAEYGTETEDAAFWYK